MLYLHNHLSINIFVNPCKAQSPQARAESTKLLPQQSNQHCCDCFQSEGAMDLEKGQSYYK